MAKTIRISADTQPKITETVVVTYVWLSTAGEGIKAIITQTEQEQDCMGAGRWLKGDAVMTVSGRLLMGFRDRITIPTELMRKNELFRRNELDVKDRSLERLRYKKGVTILSTRDKTQLFVFGVDFLLGADNTILWQSGARPKHKAILLEYKGDASTAVLDVTATEITVTLAGDQTDGSADLSIDYASFPTVADIVKEISTKTGYDVCASRESNIKGVDNKEDSTQMILAAAVDIKNIEAIIENEDRTQDTMEYRHHPTYSIYMEKALLRRHDNGAETTSRWPLRLWEHTDPFSNAG